MTFIWTRAMISFITSPALALSRKKSTIAYLCGVVPTVKQYLFPSKLLLGIGPIFSKWMVPSGECSTGHPFDAVLYCLEKTQVSQFELFLRLLGSMRYRYVRIILCLAVSPAWAMRLCHNHEPMFLTPVFLFHILQCLQDGVFIHWVGCGVKISFASKSSSLLLLGSHP